MANLSNSYLTGRQEESLKESNFLIKNVHFNGIHAGPVTEGHAVNQPLRPVAVILVVKNCCRI